MILVCAALIGLFLILLAPRAEFTELLRERDSMAGTPIFPQNAAAGSFNTGTVNMARFNRVQFVVKIGVVVAPNNVGAFLQQGNNANANDAANIAGATLPANINTSNSGATVEVNATQLTGSFVRGQIVVTGANTAFIDGTIIATIARYKPAQSNDDASFATANRVNV